MSKAPLDPFPHQKDSRSQPAYPGLPDGLYAYVRDEVGVAWVLSDGPHVHPKILGGGRSAMYAGDLSVLPGTVVDFTNLSGTFQFDDPDGLLAAADQLAAQGMTIRARAVRFFPANGSPPQVLR